MTSTNKEFLRYILKNPQFIPEGIQFYYKGAKRKINRRFNEKLWDLQNFPNPIREKVQALLETPLTPGIRKDINTLHAAHRRESASRNLPQNNLKLATGLYDFDEFPDWNKSFDDSEQTESLHRWNWLLFKLADEQERNVPLWGHKLIMHWISIMQNNSDSAAWDSYTTSERICNGLLFLYLTDQYKMMPQSLQTAFLSMAAYLAGNLEYGPDNIHNNHVLNNARALYFAGELLCTPQLSTLAKTIIQIEAPKFISPDGFVKESSSHYHFLITRWFLEIYWLASVVGDNEFKNEIEGKLEKMLPACCFFLISPQRGEEWQFPLIGDISPDCQPEWVKYLPWSSLALDIYDPPTRSLRPAGKGWNNLFVFKGPDDIESKISGISDQDSFKLYPESGWFRVDYGKATVLWHVEPAGSPGGPSHGHCDTGSFCFYLDGDEIICDPGRLNYSDDLLGVYGVSGSAHNMVIIDGKDPFMYLDRFRYPQFYRIARPEVTWIIGSDHFEFSIRHEGFKRTVGSDIVFKRRFKLFKDCLMIEDHVEGRGEYLVETFLHFAPHISISNNSSADAFEIRSEEMETSVNLCFNDFRKKEVCIYKGRMGDKPGGWRFPAYGQAEASSSLVIGSYDRLPVMNIYSFTWEM